MSSTDADADPGPSTPSPFNYILSFLLVGVCWGFTTPFIRKAAVNYIAPSHASITDPNRSWISRQVAKAFFTVLGLLRSPAYAIPLVMNLTGSIWFFLLVGQAGMFHVTLPFFRVVFGSPWLGAFRITMGVGGLRFMTGPLPLQASR
jgi:hypothetical protein